MTNVVVKKRNDLNKDVAVQVLTPANMKMTVI